SLSVAPSKQKRSASFTYSGLNADGLPVRFFPVAFFAAFATLHDPLDHEIEAGARCVYRSTDPVYVIYLGVILVGCSNEGVVNQLCVVRYIPGSQAIRLVKCGRDADSTGYSIAEALELGELVRAVLGLPVLGGQDHPSTDDAVLVVVAYKYVPRQ